MKKMICIGLILMFVQVCIGQDNVELSDSTKDVKENYGIIMGMNHRNCCWTKICYFNSRSLKGYFIQLRTNFMLSDFKYIEYSEDVIENLCEYDFIGYSSIYYRGIGLGVTNSFLSKNTNVYCSANVIRLTAYKLYLDDSHIKDVNDDYATHNNTIYYSEDNKKIETICDIDFGLLFKFGHFMGSIGYSIYFDELEVGVGFNF